MKPLFTQEELDEMRRADEEIDAEFRLTPEDLRRSRKLDRNAAYREANKEKIADYQAAWKKNNRDKWNAYLRAYRANKKAAPEREAPKAAKEKYTLT